MIRSEGGLAKGELNSYLPEIVLLVVLGVLLSYNVNLFDLEPTGEFFHVAAAKEGVLNHHFWVPQINGQPYLLRGPLWTWLMTLCFQIGGVALGVARAPSVLFALIGVFLTGMLTRSLTGNRVSGWFASAALGTCWGFVHLSVQGGADIAAMDLSLLFLWLLVEWNALAERRNSQAQEMDVYSLAMGLSLAFLFLVKDSLSVFLLAVVGIGYLAINNNTGLLKKLNPMLLLSPLILLPLPWLLIGTIGGHHPAFIGESWFIYPWQRLVGAGPWQHLQSDWAFYLRVLPLDLLPYLLFIPMVFIDRFLDQKDVVQAHAMPRRVGTTAGGAWGRWALGWFALGLLVYSFSAFQEPGLLLPFYPPLAIIAGAYLGQVMSTGDTHPSRSYKNSIAFLIIFVMFAAVLLTVFIFQVLPDNYVLGNWRFYGAPMLTTLGKLELPEAIPVWKLWLVPGPIILLVGGISLFALQARQRFSLTAPTAVGLFIAFLFFIKGIDLPIMNRAVPQQIAQDLSKRVQPGDELTLYSTRPALKRVWFYFKPKPQVRVKFETHEPFLNLPVLASASPTVLDIRAVATPQKRKRRRDHKAEEIAPAAPVFVPEAPQAKRFGVVGEKTYFQLFSASQRQLTQVLRYGWSWDHARGSELFKFLLARPPQFNKMRSGLLAFKSLTPQSEELASDAAMQLVDEETKKKKSHRGRYR